MVGDRVGDERGGRGCDGTGVREWRVGNARV